MEFLKSVADTFVKLGKDVLNIFQNFKIVYGFEILLLFIMLYYVSKILRDNDATKLMVVYWVLVITMGFMKYFVGFSASMYLVFVMVLSAVMIILFSVEIKKSLWDVHGPHTEQPKDTIQRMSTSTTLNNETAERCIASIIKALQNMSKDNVGALIVLSKGNLPKHVLLSGVHIDADISTQLVEAVFFKNAPLHDGAMVIRGHKIQAAGCFLPLTQKTTYPKGFGTRHRAGIGITEVANVVSIVVSEETGIISIIKQGNVSRYADYNALNDVLHEYYNEELAEINKKHKEVHTR